MKEPEQRKLHHWRLSWEKKVLYQLSSLEIERVRRERQRSNIPLLVLKNTVRRRAGASRGRRCGCGEKEMRFRKESQLSSNF